VSKKDDFIDISYKSKFKITREFLLNALKYAALKYAKGKLIDLGCGIKPYETIFKDYIDTYFGVDYPSTAEVNYGKDTKVDLFADCTDTKLEEGAFDTLLSTQVIEHIIDTNKFIKECCRLLKTDGIGIFTIPFVWRLHAEPFDFFRFTKFSIEKLFTDNGFEIIELKPTEGAFAALIQSRIVTHYGCKDKSKISKFVNKAVCWYLDFISFIRIPFLNFLALKFDKIFWDEKLCLNYLLIVKKLIKD